MPTPLPALRVVTFNVLPVAYTVVSQWAANGGHQLALVVTTPGPTSRRTPTYQGVVNSVPPGTDVLVTTRLRKVALPLIRALEPDLIVSFSFPYRIPLLGATLHWTEEEFDTGRILAQQTAPLPAVVTPEAIGRLWPPLMMGAFAEGIARAVAGEAGTPQDHGQASYAAEFTEEEHWMTPQETRQVFQRKCTALSLFRPAAKLRIDEQVYLLTRVDQVDDQTTAAPGTISEQTDQGFVLQVADGRVQVQASKV
jgi:methionyl-tRNA formyltransferase